MTKPSNGQIFILKVAKTQNEDCCDLPIANHPLNTGLGVDFVHELSVTRRGVDWKGDPPSLAQVAAEEQQTNPTIKIIRK